MGKTTVRKAGVFLLLAAMAFVFAVFAGSAEAGTITIFNYSGYDIHELYISSSDTDDWGQDLMGQYYLANGDETDIDIPDYDQFDIMVGDKNRKRTDWYDLPGNVVRFFVDPNKQGRWEWD